MLKVMKMQSGKVRNEMQIWADCSDHTLPSYMDRHFMVRHSQHREQPATRAVDGHRSNGLEFLGLGFVLLPIGKGQSWVSE